MFQDKTLQSYVVDASFILKKRKIIKAQENMKKRFNKYL